LFALVKLILQEHNFVKEAALVPDRKGTDRLSGRQWEIPTSIDLAHAKNWSLYLTQRLLSSMHGQSIATPIRDALNVDPFHAVDLSSLLSGP
jgi:hypothetical protein